MGVEGIHGQMAMHVATQISPKDPKQEAITKIGITSYNPSVSPDVNNLQPFTHSGTLNPTIGQGVAGIVNRFF